MRSAFCGVEIEPKLLPYEDEDLTGWRANCSTAARVDIRVPGFWTIQQQAYFDVRVTNTKASLLSVSEAYKQLERNEREKNGSIVSA